MSPWWFYLVAIFAAALLVNGVPHFAEGVAGRRFPTPFSGGPGTLDSAARNVLWGSGNLIAGGVLLWVIRAGLSDPVLVIELVAVGVAFATLIGHSFAHPERFGRRKRES
jgi:dolichol kinase